jgi:hypothetical protein
MAKQRTIVKKRKKARKVAVRNAVGTTARNDKDDNPYLPKPYTVLEFFRESPDTFTITIDMAVRADRDR